MKVEKRFDLGELAARIERLKEVSSDGKVSFSAFRIDRIQSVLESGVRFDPTIPDGDCRSLIFTAITDAAQRGVVNGRNLKAALNRAESTYLNKPATEYVVLTSFTLRYVSHLPSPTVDGSRIRITKNPPTGFDRSPVGTQIDACTFFSFPSDMVSVRIPVQARTPHHALELGLGRIDLARSLWNFSLNRTQLARMSTGPRRPVNMIRPGPVHTLHHPNGSLAVDTIWYESPDRQYPVTYDPSNKWNSIWDDYKAIRTSLSRLTYEKDLRSLLLRYVRALDSRDYDLAFNKLWGVLEGLTNTLRTNYDETVARTIFLLGDREIHRHLMEHLRNVRNAIVHHDQEHEAMERYLYQLKWFVEAMFRLYFAYGHKFGSIRELCRLLSLPHDVADILARRRLLNIALQLKS